MPVPVHGELAFGDKGPGAVDSRNIAAGPVQTVDKTDLHSVGGGSEDNRKSSQLRLYRLY